MILIIPVFFLLCCVFCDFCLNEIRSLFQVVILFSCIYIIVRENEMSFTLTMALNGSLIRGLVSAFTSKLTFIDVLI